MANRECKSKLQCKQRMQIKTPHTNQNGYHQKVLDNQYWRKCREQGTLLHCWGVCKLAQPLWRRIWSFLKKLKIELPSEAAIPLLGIYLEKTLIQKDTQILMFIAALFTIASTQKQPKCPSIDEQIKKMWYVYTMEYYSAMKGNEIAPFAEMWVTQRLSY